ncbi:MAG TPA: flagellar hook-associated protein FlgK [Candidatus Limnocylindria bacterium]|nr:flagellar hook-associated protein FlgK [Candidatus Limnocylindria bacterium]
MSFFGLSLAGSALDAYQEAANTTSNNIANVNTPGASRQVVNLVEAPPITGAPGYPTYGNPGTQGGGVDVQSITRIHQNSYDQLFRGATASQNYYTVQQQQLSSVQSAFAEPNNGVNTAFSALQTAFNQLASASATDQTAGTSARGDVLSAAQTLVAQLNSVGGAIQSAKTTAVQQAAQVVSQANTLIDQIATLNGQIRATTAVGGNPNTYEDQRDQAIDQLSQLIPTQTSVLPNGSTLVSVDGQALVNDTTAYHLAAPVVSTDASGNPQLVVGMADDPNPSSPKPVQLGTGQLGAYVDLYNNNLSSYGQQLDNFASAAANEINRVMQAGYDGNGQPGTALFQPSVAGQAITATNITVGITNADQIPAALASTAAGDLTTAANSTNNTIDTSASLYDTTTATGNQMLNNPPSSALYGTLTVTVDGQPQSFSYNMGAAVPPAAVPTNAGTIDQFISSFNAAQLGVTASFDSTSQKIVFARDPNNEGLALRTAQTQANAPTTPDFTISDTNAPNPPPATPPAAGTAATSLLETLGAGQINGIDQNASNAVGTGDNANANAAIKVFSQNYGIPALQYANTTAAGPGVVTVTGTPPSTFAQINVGQTLTLFDPTTGNQENVTVSAVDHTTGSITFTATKAYTAGYSITSAQTQTLGNYYGKLVTQLGTDTSNATTGVSSQTTLASNIDDARQSVDGINLDEETQNLVKYQNAYTAAAKTLNVIEQLLTTAVGLIPSA